MRVQKKFQCAVLAFENDRKLKKKKQLDNNEKVEVIFVNLSKAFDTINHSLLLAKLKANGFSNQALSLLQSFICNIFQRSVINSSCSSLNEVTTGVPQGETLGPLLFNKFLNDNFCLFRNINYVTIRMTTLSKSGKNTQTIKNDLKWIS